MTVFTMPRTWLSLVPSCPDSSGPSSSSTSPPPSLSYTILPALPPSSRTPPKTTIVRPLPQRSNAAKAALDRSSRPAATRDRRSGLASWVPLLPANAVAARATVAPTTMKWRGEFDFRSMQVCDVQAVKALHETTLPATYSSSYFFSLLSDPHQICLVATLPAASSHPSYFDLPPSSSPRPARSPSSPRITSTLSGQKRISLSIIGCASAKLIFPPSDNGDALRDPLSRPPTPPRNPSIRLLTLCVNPLHRRRGVASALLDRLLTNMASLARALGPGAGSLGMIEGEKEAIAASLHVQAPNSVARGFYERHGFKAMKLKRDYYAGSRLKPLESSLRKKGEVKTKPPEKDVDAWFMEKEVC